MLGVSMLRRFSLLWVRIFNLFTETEQYKCMARLMPRYKHDVGDTNTMCHNIMNCNQFNCKENIQGPTHVGQH